MIAIDILWNEDLLTVLTNNWHWVQIKHHVDDT